MRASATIAGLLLLAALGVGVTSCAKSGADSETPSAGTKLPSSRRIRIYRPPEYPECDFVKVGWVRVIYERVGSSRGREFTRAVRNAGGDAAIDVISIQGDTGVIGAEGTAIRFTDPECTR